MRTNLVTFRVNHERKNTASGEAAGETAKRLGSAERTGSARVNLRIRNSGTQEKIAKQITVYFAASNTDAL
jgi:hypothetical protein